MTIEDTERARRVREAERLDAAKAELEARKASARTRLERVGFELWEVPANG